MTDAIARPLQVTANEVEAYARHVVAAVLERLCIPFLMLDAAGKIVFTNAMSDAILADGHHARIGDNGRLDLGTADARLDIEDFLASLPDDPEDRELLLPAPDGTSPRFASLCAFTPPPMRGLDASPSLAVLFFREGDNADGIAAAREHFRLTDAEVSALAAITAGLSVEEHALRRGVSAHTARRQVYTLMRKIGVSRRSQIGVVIDRMSGRGRDGLSG